MNNSDKQFMQMAIELALDGMRKNEGGPFGAIVVKDKTIIGKGNNRVLYKNDPTAHAEIEAIREACQNINSFHLEGCTLYTLCEPCPMCMAAVYWAKISKVVFGCTRKDAAKIGFADDSIYKELNMPPSERSIPMESMLRDDSLRVFDEWIKKHDKINY
ncbi:MAG: nucleoside deaminase [Syntrophaceae bacterium]|nr:nucleoside deaminase [Syntrophaceae bacterium]